MISPRLFLVALSALLTNTSLRAEIPDFERDVAPILEARCLSCHDELQAGGDVRLDLREHALSAIMPGEPEASVLISQIAGPEPEMPKNAEPLTTAQIQTLRDWIASGASWPLNRVLKDNPPRNLDWWSLKPIEVEPTHAVSVDGKGPIDAYIDAALSEKGLSPIVETAPNILIRRLTYDLTGLPPTPEEVDAFVNECKQHSSSSVPMNLVSMKSWNALVDRLLNSPAFGEKWGRHWLDVSRYGETHGYDKDKPRNHAWPYRDYVIRAFNDDKPYDRFVQEQIAGDAIFPGERDGVLGLGFLAAGPWDHIGHSEVGEGKVDGRIAKHLDRDEMLSAVFNAFTSTTVQCAQCHHHKFDPVMMEDYYRLHAVFAAVDRADRVYAGLPPDQEKERDAIITKLAALKQERSQLDTPLKQAITARTSGLDNRIAELKQKHSSPLQPPYGWHSQISKSQDVAKWIQLDLGQPEPIHHLRLIPAYDDFGGIGAGFGFPVRYRIESSDDADFKTAIRLLHDATQADQANPKDREITIDIGGAPIRFLRVTATKLALRKADYIFAIGELEAIGGDSQENLALGSTVTSLDSIEALPRWAMANLVDGIYRRAVDVPSVMAELRTLEDERAAIETKIMTPSVALRLKQIDEERVTLEQRVESFPKGELVYAAATNFAAQGQFIATAGKPRSIPLLNRGDIRKPGDAMQPGMPPLWPGAASVFPLPANASEADARAALAIAMTRHDNPLLWRSIVNRLWQWTFGQPLVGTPNDFGRMGLAPTHPELLDFLAASLRDDPKHSLKSIVRMLVTSAAYRRASSHDEMNAAIDANNAYLWRTNPRRLTAEEIRDSLLAISGLLQIDERGGPSFQDFVIEKPQHSPHYEYHLHDPEDAKSHRRSVYRFVVRSQPQPLLTTLDCADPSLSVAARDESTTALQALTQWNNRMIEVMSRHFASRIDAAPNQKLDLACRLALGRLPTPEERTALQEHLQVHGTASLARVLFNMNAFVYVD